MTNDGKNIYQSDGKRKFGLPIPKPTNARLYQCVPGKTKIKAINELEYINGKFYANVWQKMPLQLLILKLSC
jgi:glutamine cyclotransferase